MALGFPALPASAVETTGMSGTDHASGPLNPYVGLLERCGEGTNPGPWKERRSLASVICPDGLVEKIFAERGFRCAGGVLVKPTLPPKARR